MKRKTTTPIRGTRYDTAHPLAYLDASMRVACIESGLLSAAKIAKTLGVRYLTIQSWWSGKTALPTPALVAMLRHFNLHVIPVPPEKLPQMPLAVDSILELCLGEK